MLTKERLGEISMGFILRKKEKEGIMMNPSTIKREIHNDAKGLEISDAEMAECAKVVYQHIFTETMKEIDSIIDAQQSRLHRQG